MTAEIKNIIKGKAIELHEKVRAHREYLHAHPELSYAEFETMNYVADALSKLGISFQKGVGNTGVVGLILGDHHSANQPCIGLRADLDALPIQEENEVTYKSTIDGVMHACGHDVHTSILLGTAEILHELRNKLPHPVKLIFQPGEEKNPGGATYMIRDGALKNPEVKEMYALHVFPDMEVGKAGFKEGLYMASCDEIHLTINGKGGHGATPHACIDPILIGSQIITTIQSVVSRECDPKIPCVLSFGHFEALGATNVIPSTAKLKGTFRTMNEEWREQALQLIEKHITTIASRYGATVDLEISKGYPFLYNDEGVTRKLFEKAIDYLGQDKVEELPIRLTSEDFSYYSQEVPVCFFRIGVRNEDKGIIYGVHHPRFNIDSDALRVGMELMSLAAF